MPILHPPSAALPHLNGSRPFSCSRLSLPSSPSRQVMRWSHIHTAPFVSTSRLGPCGLAGFIFCCLAATFTYRLITHARTVKEEEEKKSLYIRENRWKLSGPHLRPGFRTGLIASCLKLPRGPLCRPLPSFLPRPSGTDLSSSSLLIFLLLLFQFLIALSYVSSSVIYISLIL